MSNIYAISDWQNNTFYIKNSIVKSGTFYYYAAYSHTSPAVNSFDQNYTPLLWLGKAYDSFGTLTPHFPWICSYGFSVNSQPKVRSVKFGDSYEQRSSDGINNNLLTIELPFENRDLDEISAIAHFLATRKGVETFLFTSPAPYNTSKKFICKSWKNGRAWYNNFNLQATFEEVIA